MNILIDTQAIIWFAENNNQLSKTARAAIENVENTCYVSMASFGKCLSKSILAN